MERRIQTYNTCGAWVQCVAAFCGRNLELDGSDGDGWVAWCYCDSSPPVGGDTKAQAIRNWRKKTRQRE